MKLFILKIVFFVVILITLGLGLFLFLMYEYKFSLKELPAPNFSNSYSFNEKISFLKEKQTKVDVISMGSSMNLNNLHSKTVSVKLNTNSYLNTSSWGQNMKENFFFFKILNKKYKPKTLIISSNLVDFADSKKIIRYLFVDKFLQQTTFNTNFYFLKEFKLKYYFDNFEFSKKVRNNSNYYTYLGYDNYGGVNLKSKNFKINFKRWNLNVVDTKTSEIQYQYLDSISSFCKKNNITFLFFQSPIRKGLYSNFREEEINILNVHINKIKSILNTNRQIFVNSNVILWDDDLFLDSTHLNNLGAEEFTKFCFNNITSIKENN